MNGEAMKTAVHESHALRAVLSPNTSDMTRHEILRGIGLLRAQTDRLLEQMKKDAMAANENDSLYHELELRYGGGFAQWVVDGLNKLQANNKS